MDIKTCSLCKVEKHINNFYKNYSEYKHCDSKRGLEHYYEKEDKLSDQRKKLYEKN